jgi:hypothetical protein
MHEQRGEPMCCPKVTTTVSAPTPRSILGAISARDPDGQMRFFVATGAILAR